jgi:hypothetical protein
MLRTADGGDAPRATPRRLIAANGALVTVRRSTLLLEASLARGLEWAMLVALGIRGSDRHGSRG